MKKEMKTIVDKFNAAVLKFKLNKAPLKIVFDRGRPVLLKMPRPLDLAIKARDFDLVKNLLDAGANPNLSTHFSSPAMVEAVDWSADLKIMKLIAQYDVNINQANNAGTTALHRIVSSSGKDTEEAFAYLLSLKADPGLKDDLGHTVRDLIKAYGKPHLQDILDNFEKKKNVLKAKPSTPKK